MQTWKGTAERIFYANTASTSSSIHQIAVEHRKQQQHQNTTKLLPPPPKRRREPRVGTSGSREPNKSISTGAEERFQRIKKLLEKVLHEAEQLPAVTTRAKHRCNEKEEILDEKNKNLVVQQTIALMDSLEQLRQFQDIVCTRYLTDNAAQQTLEQADPAASSRLADANRTNEIVATTEPRERRKKRRRRTRRRRRREEEKNKIKGHRH